MIKDRKSLFKKMGLSSESIDKYENFDFSEEEIMKLKDIHKNYSIYENFNFVKLKSICDSEFFLSNSIMGTFILYLVEEADYSFFDLFNKKISNDPFVNNEFRKQIFSSMEQAKSLQLDIKHIFEYCNAIFVEGGDITLYQRLSQVINDELFEKVINEYTLEPKRSRNYLIIFILENRNKLQGFIDRLQIHDLEDALLLTQACLEISKKSKEFAVRIVKDRLISKIDYQWDEIDLLINFYSNLLYTLIMDSEDEILAGEIRKISGKIRFTQLRSIIYIIYKEEKSISHKCAECLLLNINELLDDNIQDLKYPISHIYSLLNDHDFVEFCVPVLSVIGIEKNNPLFDRIQNNSNLVLNGLMQNILDLEKHSDVAIKVVKFLYKKRKIFSFDFEEQYFFKYLRIFHCFEIDADFICNIAIEFFLSTSSKTAKYELYEYILSSIYDNYFYLLEEKVASLITNEPELEKLNLELLNRKKLHEQSWRNPDFKPSEKNMNIYYEKEAERNRKISKEAEENSVFSQLFSKQTILYGHKVQYKQIDAEGKLHTQISEMKEMTYSIAIPVRFINDPMFHKSEMAIVLEDKQHD